MGSVNHSKVTQHHPDLLNFSKVLSITVPMFHVFSVFSCSVNYSYSSRVLQSEAQIAFLSAGLVLQATCVDWHGKCG